MSPGSSGNLGHRKNILFILVMILFFGIFARFYSIQIINFDKYSTQSANNSVRKIIKKAPRGIIFDRYNVPIVDNRPTYDLSVVPFDVSDQFNFSLFSKIVGLDEYELKTKVDKLKRQFSRFKPSILKRHINFEIRSDIEENLLEFPGVHFSDFPARTYPNEARLTHVLGYLREVNEAVLENSDPKLKYQNEDVFGFSGLEKIYESSLRGEDGVEFRLVDIYGIDHGKFSTDREYDIVKGDSLILTIDSRLQSYAEKLMVDKKGSVISMNPQNGDVLAYVSSPDYDLKSFVGPIPHKLWNSWSNNPDKPLMNRGIQGTYPPGSVFKLIASAIALEDNLVSTEWSVNCTGAYTYGDRTFHCWNTAGHGEMNMKNSIKHSCNIYFYKLIQKIPFEQWSDFVTLFGFGSKTGIDLPGEKKGIVPTREYMNKKYTSRGWGKGSLLNFVIGQGDVLATPQQVVQFMNYIATKGNAVHPHLNIDAELVYDNVTLKKNTWNFLEKATYAVVNEEDGTGKNALIDIGIVRGKTGTAQNPHGEDHSWFSGYVTLPNKKQMSLAVIVENGGKGSQAGAGVAREMFKLFSEYYND